MKCVEPFAGSRVAVLASKWVKVKVGVVWEATAVLAAWVAFKALLWGGREPCRRCILEKKECSIIEE